MRAVALLAVLLHGAAAVSSNLRPSSGSRLPLTPIGQTRRLAARSQKDEPGSAAPQGDTDPALLYPAQYIDIPVDHFFNESQYAPHSTAKYKNRYWFDDTYYKPGGPVFVLQAGEQDAAGVLEYLQHGILYALSNATGGIGILLEHRYYGNSFPTPNLSVENLRFLTTQQALADMAYLAQNIVLPGHETENLTSHTTPYIAYGGSYSGAVTAILRTLYPDVYWGAISSSGVTEAIYDYWQYYEPVRQYGPQKCIQTQQKIVHLLDNIFEQPKKNADLINLVRNLTQLQDLSYNTDVLNALANGIGGLQSTNWDTIDGDDDPDFYQYCSNITSKHLVDPKSASMRADVQKLIKAGGYGREVHELTNPFINFITWNIANTVEADCTATGETINDCYNTQNVTAYQEDGLDAFGSRSWPWQFCNQWGFFQTGSGVPKDQLPLISRLIDLEYETTQCRDAFGINKPPNTQLSNQYGGFNISYPRLALIGGEWDPWRPATPLADNAPKRQSTTDQPFLLISKAVHHWDEYDVFANQTTATFPPQPIKQIHEEEISFVKAWLEEYKQHQQQ